MPAEGLHGAGFTSPKWLGVFSHACAPRLALGLRVFGIWAGSSAPTAPRRLLRTLSLREKALGKGSVCPPAMGRLPWSPILEGAQPHGNQWPPAHTRTPAWPRPLSHETPRLPVSPVSVLKLWDSCSGPGLICDIPIERRFDRQVRFFFQVHFLPNTTSLLTGSKLEISTIYSELRL